ncbi:MAG: glycosyltransferase family 2 protein [Fusobacteria bacterium]|nr:glycosyltransferase family 2 protein [Fusobacteriota bacterium]
MIFKKLVSVIVPAYNHDEYIEACLKSILEQSYSKLELIIVNDGSVDETHEKILAFEKKHRRRFKRFIYVKREHKGAGDTLNELITLAKGEFLFQIASDDIAKKNAVAVLADFLKRNIDYALVVGDNEIIDDQGNRVYWDKDRNNLPEENLSVYKTFGEFLQAHRPDVDFDSDDFGELGTLLKGNYIPNGKMFRRSALLKVGGYEKDMLEDWYINIKLAKRYRLKYIDQILFSYRWHGSNTIKNLEYIKKIESNMKDFLEEYKREYNKLPEK